MPESKRTSWWRRWRPVIIRDLALAGLVTAMVSGVVLWVEQGREEQRFERAETLEELRFERAQELEETRLELADQVDANRARTMERLENLRFVRSAIAEPDTDRWRNFVEIDLEEMNLSGLDLSESDLSYATLSWAILRDTDLRNANLTGTNLRNADLRDADLRGANLSYASFAGSDFAGSRFDGANISKANFLDVNHHTGGNGGSIYDTDFSGVWWAIDDPPYWPEWFIPPSNAFKPGA